MLSIVRSHVAHYVQDVQKRDICTPVPASIVFIQPIRVVQLLYIEFAFTDKVVITAHNAGEGTHETTR